MIIYALNFEESQLKFLAVSTELSCESVARRLQITLRNRHVLEVLQGFLKFDDLGVRVLVVLYHVFKQNFIFCNNGLAFVDFRLSFASVSLEIDGHVDDILAV